MERMEPETPESFYARVQAAAGPDGRLAVAVEEMPGWDIFPFEIDSLRMKPLQPLADAEPPRAGEKPPPAAGRRRAATCRRGPRRVLVRTTSRARPGPADGRARGVEQRALGAPPRHLGPAPDRPQPRASRALCPADGARPPRG